MTQETKLTEPVQVGLWYQAKAGFITQIDFVENRPDGDFFLGNNGVFYNEYGETTYSVEHNLIRCLGADPFKQVDISKTETVAPTQFERIFTAFLPYCLTKKKEHGYVASLEEFAISEAITLTQEAIKQLKEIEGA